MLDRARGKAVQAIRTETDGRSAMAWDGLTPKQKRAMLREAMAELARRKGSG